MSVSRVYRLLRLVTMLQGRRSYTVNELAEELQVSRRTVFRDMNMLEMAHIPYYYDPDTKGYRISRHFFLPPLNLTFGEALAMLVLTGQARGSKRRPLLGQAIRAGIKLENALPAPVRRHVGQLMDRMRVIHVPASGHEGLDAMFDELLGAIAARNVCRLVYISFYERKQIVVTVHPLRLVFVGRAWYLLAWSVRRRMARTYKLARVKKLTVTERTFAEPEDLDIDKHFGQAWGMIPEGKIHDIHLRFSRKVAGNVAEVRWHPTQTVKWNDDGTMDFRVSVDGVGEIVWWVLGYGDQVEVVAPKQLRKRVAAVAEAVAKQYRKESRSE